jgi:hypothetical protein
MGDMNVYARLAKARVMLQKKALKKSGENKYAGFKYFELADFLPSVNEIFAEVGLCSQFYITTEKVENLAPEGYEPYYTDMPSVAYLEIINTDMPPQNVTFSSAIAEAAMKGASPIQQLGSVHTYMRRYLWLEAMEITECDGVDALNQKEQIETTPKPKVLMITPDQMHTITSLFEGDTERMKKMMDVYRVTGLEQLNAKQAANIIRRLEAKK